jgi:hypothetical protein
MNAIDHVHHFSASPYERSGNHWYRKCKECHHEKPISADLAQQMLGRRFVALEGAVRKRVGV